MSSPGLAKLPMHLSTAAVSITVGNAQPPIITAPANFTVSKPSSNSNCAVVNDSDMASDN